MYHNSNSCIEKYRDHAEFKQTKSALLIMGLGHIVVLRKIVNSTRGDENKYKKILHT
jgi:hypothetical protein